ncbi:MAG: ATP-binding protein [Anaerolineales bacterium]
MRHPLVFPFTAIVGQDQMKRALILNAINPSIGGVLIRGEKGTAKSTAVRALAALLPMIDVIEGSPFHDNPHNRASWSDYAKTEHGLLEKPPVARRRIKLVDLPVSATEDRVVGTLDIEKAIKTGEKHFEPGVLAAANRGILYVDEVNLLDDHIVDLLLDSAAMGVNVVEREGISFSHPAKFMLVGTMNPEEGELRPQLLDRFALSVEIHGLREAVDRVQILERHIGFDTHPEAFCEQWRPSEEELSARIEAARQAIDAVRYTERDLYLIANLTASMHVDGHRADLVILKTARTNAAFEGRGQINDHDILIAAELALPHRMKRNPFSDGSLDEGEIQGRLEEFAAEYEDAGAEADAGNAEDETREAESKKKQTP